MFLRAVFHGAHAGGSSTYRRMCTTRLPATKEFVNPGPNTNPISSALSPYPTCSPETPTGQCFLSEQWAGVQYPSYPACPLLPCPAAHTSGPWRAAGAHTSQCHDAAETHLCGTRGSNHMGTRRQGNATRRVQYSGTKDCSNTHSKGARGGAGGGADQDLIWLEGLAWD